MNFIEKNFKNIIIVGIFLFFFLLLFKNLAPFGVKTMYTFDFEKNPNYISDIASLQPVTAIGQKNGSLFAVPHTAIYSDITEVKLKLPQKNIKKARVSIFFDTGVETRIGFLNNLLGNYSYKAIFFPELNNLSWKYLKENSAVLFQKAPRYTSVRDFLADPPESTKDSPTFATFEMSFFPKNLFPQKKGSTFVEVPLRGNHTLYTYVTNENFVLTIQKQDMNDVTGADPLRIFIYHDDELLLSSEIPDDGNEEAGIRSGLLQEKTIAMPKLLNGIYRIELQGNSADFLIKKISVNQPYLVFTNIFLANSPIYRQEKSEKSTVLFTNAKHIAFSTWHEVSYQNIQINNKSVLLNKLITPIGVTTTEPLSVVETSMGDVIIQGDQPFSFSLDALFDPFIFSVPSFQSLSVTPSIEYVLSSYVPPEKYNGWFYAEREFSLDESYIAEDGTLSFRIYAPHLKQKRRVLNIKSMNISVE